MKLGYAGRAIVPGKSQPRGSLARDVAVGVTVAAGSVALSAGLGLLWFVLVTNVRLQNPDTSGLLSLIALLLAVFALLPLLSGATSSALGGRRRWWLRSLIANPGIWLMPLVFFPGVENYRPLEEEPRAAAFLVLLSVALSLLGGLAASSLRRRPTWAN